MNSGLARARVPYIHLICEVSTNTGCHIRWIIKKLLIAPQYMNSLMTISSTSTTLAHSELSKDCQMTCAHQRKWNASFEKRGIIISQTWQFKVSRGKTELVIHMLHGGSMIIMMTQLGVNQVAASTQQLPVPVIHSTSAEMWAFRKVEKPTCGCCDVADRVSLSDVCEEVLSIRDLICRQKHSWWAIYKKNVDIILTRIRSSL